MDNNRHIYLRLKGNVGHVKADVDSYGQSEIPYMGRVSVTPILFAEISWLRKFVCSPASPIISAI